MNPTAIDRLDEPIWHLEDEDESSSHLHELEDKVQKDLASELAQPDQREEALKKKWRLELKSRKSSIIRSEKDLEHMIKHLQTLLRRG